MGFLPLGRQASILTYGRQAKDPMAFSNKKNNIKNLRFKFYFV